MLRLSTLSRGRTPLFDETLGKSAHVGSLPGIPLTVDIPVGSAVRTLDGWKASTGVTALATSTGCGLQFRHGGGQPKPSVCAAEPTGAVCAGAHRVAGCAVRTVGLLCRCVGNTPRCLEMFSCPAIPNDARCVRFGRRVDRCARAARRFRHTCAPDHAAFRQPSAPSC